MKPEKNTLENYDGIYTRTQSHSFLILITYWEKIGFQKRKSDFFYTGMDEFNKDSGSYRQLLTEVQATQQRIAEESSRLARLIQELMMHRGSQAAANLNDLFVNHPYEFFRSTNGWQIRFENKLVSAGRNDKGLQYIHKLLLYPNRKFYPNELDPGFGSSDTEVLISGSETFSIERDIKYQQMNPGDEDAHRRALDELRKNKPEGIDSLEKHIYFYSQMCYLADSLKNIRALPLYIALYKEAKERLDDLVFEFEQSCDDKLFVQRVINQSGQIRSTARDGDNITRKMRERVVKNIQNAIKGMGSEAAQNYFTEHIKIGVQSVYNPDPVLPISWRLETYE